MLFRWYPQSVCAVCASVSVFMTMPSDNCIKEKSNVIYIYSITLSHLDIVLTVVATIPHSIRGAIPVDSFVSLKNFVIVVWV